MAAFRDGTWANRFKAMGDEAEGVFEATAKRGFVRFGLNRPPIQMHKLPARVRYTPDYLMSAKFVEVQGCGRDQLFKLKLDKHGALRWWNDLLPVEMFLWDTTNKRWCFVTLSQLESLIPLHCVLDAFPEGHAYFSFEADAIFEASSNVGEYDDAVSP